MSSETLEIERLLSEIADEGPSRERSDRLESLLLDRPDLQQYYSRVIALHTLLAFELNLATQEFSPLVGGIDDAALSCPANDCVELARQMRVDADSGTFVERRRRGWTTVLGAIAVSVACVALAANLWMSDRDARLPKVASSNPQAEMEAQVATDEAVRPRSVALDRVVRDTQALGLLSRVTKTPLCRLILPVESRLVEGKGGLQLTLCSGMVWMERCSGERDRGYMLALPSGAVLDLVVEADADARNALAVTELDSDGRTTGRTISFNNQPDTDKEGIAPGYGCIGIWSERNDTAENKYYLFTGTHILPQQTKDQDWYLSDYKVFLESPGLMHIGWDDSGYAREAEPTSGDYIADYDFDDINATIRILLPDDPESPDPDRKGMTTSSVERFLNGRGPADGKATLAPVSLDGIQTIPALDRANRTIGPEESGYQLSVPPGEILVLRVNSKALLPSSFAIVDQQTRRIMWTRDGNMPEAGSLGVYAIKNDTPETRHFLLLARHRTGPTDSDEPWYLSSYRVLRDEGRFQTIGFEDVVADGDWNDVKAHALWIAE